MLQLPNYLHIGFSKAASTWFQNYLRKEKDIFLVYKTYYFFPFTSINYEKGIQWYAEQLTGASGREIAIESREHIILPYIHPELECACINLKGVELISGRIKENLPDIKIVVIIRNQVDTLLSRYTQYILQGGKLDASTFFEKLAFASDCWLSYVDYRYSKIINILYEVFGKGNVLVLFQEELKSNRELFFDDLSRFFKRDFSPSSREAGNSANAAPSYWGGQLIRSLNKAYVRYIETRESKTRSRGPYTPWLAAMKLIRTADNALIGNKRKNKLITKDELERIHRIYSPDNKELAKLFNKPVAEYGYI